MSFFKKSVVPAGSIKPTPEEFTPKANRLSDKAEDLYLAGLHIQGTVMLKEARAIKKVAEAYKKLGQ